MAARQKNVRNSTQHNQPTSPQSLKLATAGVKTGGDFAGLMSALMSDVIEGSISPGVANAAVNAGGKLLKAVELTIKFGQAQKNGDRVLRLVAEWRPRAPVGRNKRTDDN